MSVWFSVRLTSPFLSQSTLVTPQCLTFTHVPGSHKRRWARFPCVHVHQDWFLRCPVCTKTPHDGERTRIHPSSSVDVLLRMQFARRGLFAVSFSVRSNHLFPCRCRLFLNIRTPEDSRATCRCRHQNVPWHRGFTRYAFSFCPRSVITSSFQQSVFESSMCQGSMPSVTPGTDLS